MNSNDWFMVIFSLVIGTLLLITNIREYKRFKIENDAEIKRKKYECFDDSKRMKTLCVMLVALGVVLVIISAINKDCNSIALGNMVMFLFAGQFVLTNKRFVMYYNDEAFVVKGKRYSYQSVKEVKQPNLKFGMRTVKFISGGEVRLSKECVTLVEQKIRERKEMKKNNKGVRR